MFPPEERERLPLPSEDSGDLVEEPSTGETDDPLVAAEEAVTYVPPLDRVISEPRSDEGGPDVAGAAADEAEELEREDGVQPTRAPRPRDDELLADVLETLRDSDLPAGEELRVAARGSTIVVRGEVESVDILDEILGLIGDVPGVENVVDEVQVRGV
jgi:hypothetical protein